ncbi:MAG: hypothetical protein V2A66_01290 [Pseudomonadota bacterium]
MAGAETTNFSATGKASEIGLPPGPLDETWKQVMEKQLRPHHDEVVIVTGHHTEAINNHVLQALSNATSRFGTVDFFDSTHTGTFIRDYDDRLQSAIAQIPVKDFKEALNKTIQAAPTETPRVQVPMVKNDTLSHPTAAREIGGFATDISIRPETRKLRLHADPLAVTVNGLHRELGGFRCLVLLELRNNGTESLQDVSVTVSGPGLLPVSRLLDTLPPHGTAAIELRTAAVRVQQIDEIPVWDLNRPLTVSVEFTAKGKRTAAAFPAGYWFYGGWGAGFDELPGMALADAPPLDPYVKTLRTQLAARGYLTPFNSVQSRQAAAEEIAQLVLNLGIHYYTDGAYLSSHSRAGDPTHFPSETVLYNGGDCDDFTVLAGYFLHALGIPFAAAGTPGHVSALTELERGAVTEQLKSTVSETSFRHACGNDICTYQALDLSLIDKEPNPQKLVQRGTEWWIRHPERVITPSWSSDVAPPFGKSWLATSSGVEILPEAGDFQLRPW